MARNFVAWLLASTLAAAVGAEGEFSCVSLDDFEDVSAWVKGEADTSFAHRDFAVTASREKVKQGSQSLAFMIRVNWTSRPGEEYPKGWPMISREFPEPQDWSRFDAVRFWLYVETQAVLPADRALRCGFGHRGQGIADEDWYTVPGLQPNKWQQITVPLQPDRHWDDVTQIAFYVAESWYQDGDRINFYLDDMRLAKRNWPVLDSFEADSRILPRGSGIAVSARIMGPWEGSKIRWRVTTPGGKVEAAADEPVAGRLFTFTIPSAHLPPGGHYVTAELVDPKGKSRDSARRYVITLEPHRRAYLALITFYTSVWRENPEVMTVLNDSAYMGVAVPVWSAYDTRPIEPYAQTIAALKALQKKVKIDIWPWVFSNRFVGMPEDAKRHPSVAESTAPDYFARIRGMDLDDEVGARSDMLTQWRYAVRAAKELGVPGIVLDLEAYNNYKAYDVHYVAERRSESLQSVVRKCEQLGAELARICEEEYPKCIVWSLFSRLEASQRHDSPAGPLYSTAGHISLGFLKYAREHHLPCKYLCGGETTPGYYNPNVDALKRRIAKRDSEMAEVLAVFPHHLFLAGTISPYHDHTILTGWIKEAAGDDPELKTIHDFEPMFRTLFHAYDWVWVYCASAARAEPYNPELNRFYSDVLRRALKGAAE